jgi:tetratricopeptide (TPR) repeat protein
MEMNRKARRAADKKTRKGTDPAPSRNRTETGSSRIASLFAEAIRCQQSGQHAEAVAFYDRIVADNPNLASVHCNRGVALVSVGRFADAEAAYASAIAIKPELPEAYNNLGELLRNLGRYDEAAQALARAVALNPHYAEAFGNLGNTLKDQGRPRDAETVYRAAVALAPHTAQAHNNLGAILFDLERLDEAEQALRHALTLAPDLSEAHLNLGNVLKELGRFGEAEIACRRASELNPQTAEAHCSLGNVLVKLDRFEEAEAAYRCALALEPGLAEAHHNLGVTLKFLGRLAEAREAVDRAIALAPRKAVHFLSLGELKSFADDDPAIAAMEDLLVDTARLPVKEQINLHFALAKAYDDVGRRDDGFRQLLAGNTLKRRNAAYDEAAALTEIARTAEVFSPELIRKFPGGEPSAVPIFVIGMPRSGSTLIEQILSSHPQVSGVGELPLLADAAAEIGKSRGSSLPDVMADLSGDELRQFGARYVAEITAFAPDAARIVNKTLSNFIHAGLIHLALPRARIIHAVRDPVATCMSCFSKLFAAGQFYCYDLAELGRYYRHYRALMEHWHRVLPPGRILDMRYEDVVADLEGQARRMIAYCGLDWDERCLAFHETERPVLTASAVQVRQPLYRAALDRGRDYHDHLAPLLAELSGDGGSEPHSAPRCDGDTDSRDAA